MKKITVCHFTTVHHVLDDRIFYKECGSLLKHGFRVLLLVPFSEDTCIDGVEIIALMQGRSRLSRITLGSIEVFRKVMRTKADICHFHDPELMPVGVLLRIFGKKVVFDVHEDLPLQVLYKQWIKYGFLRKTASVIIRFIEKVCCVFFQGIVSVTDDIYKKYKPSKTILLRNYPLLKLMKIDSSTPITKPDNCKMLIYAGGLSEIRGIREIIDALPLIERPVMLWLFGTFENDQYKKRCEESHGWKHVIYMGQQPLTNVLAYVNTADIGLAMLYPIKNYLNSLPVKAFEYMAFSKPIVMSNFEYWEEVFRDCSLFANPYSCEEIAEKIRWLIDDRRLYDKLGLAGRHHIESFMSWEAEEGKLIQLYKQILKIDNL